MKPETFIGPDGVELDACEAFADTSRSTEPRGVRPLASNDAEERRRDDRDDATRAGEVQP